LEENQDKGLGLHMSSEKEAENVSLGEDKATEVSKSVGTEGRRRESSTRPAEEEELGEEVGVLTISLGKVWAGSQLQRAPKAIRIVRRAAARHLKPEDRDSLKVSRELNRILWSRGRMRPPRRVRVRVFKNEDGVYTLRPVEAT